MSAPDAILINADIRTMDVHSPRVQGLAIAGGRIRALGTTEEITALAGPDTQVIDGAGRLVLPGFHDTHLHVIEGGQHHAASVDLSMARSPEEIVSLLMAFAARHDRPWVEGAFYDSGIIGDHNMSAAVLDRAVSDRPCIMLASDGHNGCVNTCAMEVMGLTSTTPDPKNGHFPKGQDGRPTGMLHERAVTWARDKMPAITDQDYTDGIAFALRHANQHGITGVLDASIDSEFARIYRGMAERNALTARVLATVRVDAAETTEAAVARVEAIRRASQMPMFRVHSVKFFLDGVIENRTAAMIEDYVDAEGGNAPLMFGREQIRDMFTAFDALRYQIHVHCIGDMAVRAALDGFEAARSANQPWPSLHQIAHVQFIDPADVPRFAELGVVANIQPLWACAEPAVTVSALPLVGERRGKWIYAFRALRDAGALLALSSDWTVSTLNPFEIIATALTRQPAGQHETVPPFLPEQRLTLAECIEGYTINAAAAGWRAADTGSLSPGKWADLIILDRNIYACLPQEIAETKVLTTLLGGQAVWSLQ
ncbi:MAG: amidohydrolase [bacterium]